jgi:hypothetical protein
MGSVVDHWPVARESQKLKKTHTLPIPEDEEARAGLVANSATIMLTSHQTCDRNQLPNLCPFVSMFAKASCALRKSQQINELRCYPQWRAVCPGHNWSRFLRAFLARSKRFDWFFLAGNPPSVCQCNFWAKDTADCNFNHDG